MKLRAGSASRVGPHEPNEDRSLICRLSYGQCEVLLLAVADGLGGDANGERAAEETVGFLPRLFDHLPLAAVCAEPDRFRSLVITAVQEWYRALLEHLGEIARQERARGLSTTLCAALVCGNQAAVWWLGDTRAFRFTQGALERLTSDHSLVEQTLHLPEEEALEHPERSQLLRFVRPGVPWQPSVAFSTLEEGDVLLLASDGLTSSCKSWELEAFLAYLLAAEVDPDTVCERVLDYVSPNMHDNATVVLSCLGVPKPFGRAVASLDELTMVRRGLHLDLVSRLRSYPAGEAAWRERGRPPWRIEKPSSEAPNALWIDRIAGPLSPSAPGHTVCLLCGRVSADDRCPEHGRSGLWRGAYLEILSPSGERRYYGLASGVTTIGRGDDVRASIALADEALSAQHVIIRRDPDGAIEIQDGNSDNGVWARITRQSLWPALPAEDEMVLAVGHHQVAVRSTVSNRGG